MNENEISKIVVNCLYDIHVQLGPGLFESVYETILIEELRFQHLQVLNQVPIPVIWRDKKLELGFRADIVVEQKLIVEIKSIEKLADVHYKQVLTYLRLAECKLGLLVNFNESLIKNGIRRIVNDL